MIRLIFKTILWCIAIIVAFTAVLLVLGSLLSAVAVMLGMEPDGLSFVTYAVLFVLLFLPKKYLSLNIPYTLSANTVIDAPIATVWDAIAPRPRDDTFRLTYSAIRAVPGRPDQFEFIFATPLDQEPGVTKSLIMTQLEAVPPHQLTLRHDNTEDQGGLGVGGSTEYWELTETDDGTEVTFREEVDRTSLWLLVTLAIVNPARDMLRSLKHQCEGTEDTSWMANQMRLAQDPDGPKTSTGLMVAGLTACVFLTVVAFGLVFGLARLV